uniref:Uncharacterized protein n=1 Tax=Setaria italica TaxID=4555 RepID=K3ZPH2_SETIT
MGNAHVLIHTTGGLSWLFMWIFSIFLTCERVTSFWPLKHNILAIYPYSREKKKMEPCPR